MSPAIVFVFLLASARDKAVSAKADPAAGEVTRAETGHENLLEPVELPTEIFAFPTDDRTPLHLSVSDCVELTVAENLDLIGALLDQASAQANIGRAVSSFTPTINASGGYRSDALIGEQGASTTGQAESRDDVGSGNIDMAASLPTGTGVDVSLGVQSRNSNYSLDFYQQGQVASLRVELTQSLIQRLGIKVNLADYNAAKAGKKAADLRLQAALESIVQVVANTYYNLYQADEVAKIRREGRQLALELLDVTKKRIATGSAAPSEIFQAQSTLASRYSAELSADQDVVAAEEALIALFNARIRADGRVSANNLFLVTDIPSPAHTAQTLGELTDLALDQRPDFLAIKEDQKAADLQLYVASRQLAPELTASVYAEGDAQAGRYTPYTAALFAAGQVQDPRLAGNMGTAFSNLGSSVFYSYGIMLNLNLPLYYGAQRYAWQLASSAYQRVVASREIAEQRVRSDVALAYSQQNRAIRQIAMAKISLSAARQNLAAETKKQKLGSSTAFDVLRIQDEVVTALATLAEAQAELGRDVAALQYAIGAGRQGKNFAVTMLPPTNR